MKSQYLPLIALMVLVDLGGVSAQQPNIIFMLSDDQGWNGLSVAMHPSVEASKHALVQTPQLEKLAAQGMRFSAAYAPSPVCASTRCSLLNGKSPAQNRWTRAGSSKTAADNYPLVPPRNPVSLSEDEITIAELLHQAGYATAHFGKWHLRGRGPGEHGYDEHDGNIGNEYAARFKDPNPVDIFGMADRADAFMEKNVQSGKPFFMQLSWHALHEPQNALEATKTKYERLGTRISARQAARAAIAEDLDTGVGRVLAAIDRLGIADNTYVIYMSDNGASPDRRGDGGPLRGSKGSVWEGGIRVPMIVRGPGVARGSWCHEPVVGYDWFPTFCRWAGVSALPAGIEGGSLVGLLSNAGRGQVERPRAELVFHFPHYQSEDGPHTAIMLDDLKLIKFYETGRLALYDLSEDLGEKNDLSRQFPGQTRRLHEKMTAYLSEVDAALPTANQSYDPNKPSADYHAEKKRGDRGKKRRASQANDR